MIMPEIHNSRINHTDRQFHAGVSLSEAMAAVVILGLITTSVLVVMTRCITAATETRAKMQAFEVARENMEILLASATVSDMAETGTSEQYPDIEWQTAVEPFYEPVTSRMWIQAVSSASYTDSNSVRQTVELTSWITDVTKEQLMQILEQQKKEEEYFGQFDLLTQSPEMKVRQQAIRDFLKQAGLDADAYAKFLAEQKKEVGSFLLNADYDDAAIAQLKNELSGSENAFLESIGFNDQSYNAFLETYIPPADLTTPDGDDSANPQNKKPETADTKKPAEPSEEYLGGYTREEIMNMPLDELFRVLTELSKKQNL